MTRTGSSIALFALDASRALGEKTGDRLGVPLAGHEEVEFPDGECKCRPTEDVGGKDAFVVHSLFRDASGSQNDKLMRLLLLLGAVADAGAARVTAVVPYLCYARQDRRADPRDPVTTRYLARMFEAAGTNRIVAMDVHSPAAFENAFRIPVRNIETTALFCAHLAGLIDDRDAIVVSPDAGGVRRAERLRRALSAALKRQVASAFVEKQRAASALAGRGVVGEFAGRAAVVVDDLICTGATTARAARICRDLGAGPVFAAATHAAFAGDAQRTLADAAIDQVIVTNSIAVPPLMPNLTVLDAAGLIAESISGMHAV